MIFSESWLREWVNPAWSTEQLVAEITMAGLEVDAVEAVASDFSGVIVAEIVAAEQHPDADKLRVCQVNFGGDQAVQVVCGAPNARVGLKVAFAQVGAVLKTEDNSDFKIKKAKLRGVESFGMLCGASELGMEDVLDGLMELSSDATVGADLREYLDLNDTLIDVDLTPNRGDCLSILGIARDVGVLSQTDLNMPKIEAVSAAIDETIDVDIQASDDCPTYVSRVINHVDLSQASPLWMVEKLRRSGIRSIDPVVDVTNYVLLELGQPMHAFDKAKLAGGIVVRKAKAGEQLTLLDEQILELQSDSLVIADHDKALALAGIMGGLDSGVSQTTSNIVFESAFFAPEKIAGRARSYGLHTDSSHRFERGVDLANQVRAVERATALLLAICGGEPGPTVVHGQAVAEPRSVSLKAQRLAQVLGAELPHSQVSDILQRLGFTVDYAEDVWHCSIPSWRFDVSIEADLVEEIARVYGYNQLPTRQMRVPVDFVRRQEAETPLMSIKHTLVARGYQEAIAYTFIEPSLQADFDDEAPVAVANPISSDMAVMRTSLIPGLVRAMQHNLKRQVTRLKLFESGLQFHASDADSTGAEQRNFIAGIATGNRLPESWANHAEPIDFFDIKGDVESLLLQCRLDDVSFVAAERKGFHPGQTANIVHAGKVIGYLGCLHPEMTKNYGIAGQAFAFELSLAELTKGNVPSFKSLSKFPQVRRDLAIVINESVAAGSVLQAVRDTAGENFVNAWIFDVYQGKGVAEGHKSLAIAMSFQHQSRSLQDDEIQTTIDAIVDGLQDNFSATLR
ncbi:MAG: phenylalanine--tRNA ligase subunit beta [Pseudomonadales bacterium]|nr:phenylalanine--tRNA ligase subunit beta [Pseudomonadales bacterium]